MPAPTTALPTGWATAAGADVDTPSGQRLANGWVAGLAPPAGEWNWLLQRLFEWANWTSTAIPLYATLEAAYTALEEGDLCIVHEDDRSDYPSTIMDNGPADGADCLDVCCTGDRVVYVTSGVNNPKLVSRANITVVIKTFTRTNAGNAVRIATDGTKVFLAYGNYVEAWDIEAGTSSWVYDHGASVNDICVYDQYVYLVGASGTGAKDARALEVATGILHWSYNHNATLTSVAAANGRCFIGGGVSGHASGANLRSLNAFNGYDATGEGGTIDTDGLAWNRVLANVVSARCLAVDHSQLYLGFASGAANQVEAMSQGDAQIQIMVRALTGISVIRLAVDQDYVYAATQDATPDGYLFALDRNTLATAWTKEYLTKPFTCVATDGAGVFAGRGSIAGGQPNFDRYRRGNRACMFRRYTGASAGVASAAFPNPRSMVIER